MNLKITSSHIKVSKNVNNGKKNHIGCEAVDCKENGHDFESLIRIQEAARRLHQISPRPTRKTFEYHLTLGIYPLDFVTCKRTTESSKDLNKDSIITKTEFDESYYVHKIPQEHQQGNVHKI